MNESTDGIYEEALSPLAVRHMPTDDVNTSEDVDDDRLLLAAEMGQMLLAKNQEKEERIAELEEQLLVAQEEVDHLRKSVAILSRDKADLQTMYDQQIEKVDRISRELSDASEKIASQQQQELQLVRGHDELVQSLRQQVENVQMQLDKSQAKEEPLRAKLARLRSELHAAKETISSADTELHSLSRELATTKSQLDHLRSVESSNKTLKAHVHELMESVARLEQTERENKELRILLSASEQRAKDLTERYDRERQALESTREEMSLRQEMEAQQAPPSMLDELALDMQARIGARQTDPHNRSQEDFFFLTAISVKMNASERKQELMCRIPTKDLYKQAIDEQVPFFQYYSWITYQLDRLYSAEEEKHSPPPPPPKKGQK